LEDSIFSFVFSLSKIAHITKEIDLVDKSRNDGRGNFGNTEQHIQAGKQGGEATAKTHDKKFYEEIGSKGGKASTGSFKKGDSRATLAGREGGKISRKND
jgi:general stress protein YciG